MANIIESRVTLEDEVFEETIDTMEEPIEVIRPSSYNDMEDLPQVNGVTLIGNKTSEDLGIVTATDIENAVSAEATLRENADTALGGRIDSEITNRTNADNALGTRIDNEILARQGGDNNLQTQIDAITSKSDVVDVVADYAALQAYDTQHLGNNDVIKVLDDETHEDAQTYYRWNKTAGTWSYIGSEAPYYSKGQMDTMLQAKQDKLIAGANIQIAQDGKTISATDTTYTAGNGLNLNGTEFSADTTVLATKSDLDSYYTKTETDTKLAPKLEAEVVAELPTTGTEGKLYLTPKNYNTGTATGNPITISLGEDAGQITSFQLDGDTFQQTYTGKNLFDSSLTMIRGFVSNSGIIDTNTTSSIMSEEYIPVSADTDYTFSWTPQIAGSSVRNVAFYDGSKACITRVQNTDSVNPFSVTTTSGCAYIRFSFYNANGMTPDNPLSTYLTDIQLERGSSATSYEPFVGGQPSPSPDYPQQIQTVTGTQTISINGTDYPINLGSLELCKLGTYQDYIWKDGEDWKVHKAIGYRLFTGLEDWQKYSDGFFYASIGSLAVPVNAAVACYSENYKGVTSSVTMSDFETQSDGYSYAMNVHRTGQITRIKNTDIQTSDALKTWLQSNPTFVYYPVATPTDTTITDTALIAQLEAIRTAALESGSNTISNTATGTNLAGDMEFDYYEYDPTNRYDKWLWLNLNNNYEQIGGE